MSRSTQKLEIYDYLNTLNFGKYNGCKIDRFFVDKHYDYILYMFREKIINITKRLQNDCELMEQEERIDDDYGYYTDIY